MEGLTATSVLQISGELVAVAAGEREGEALLTFARAVEVYNVHSCRCVHSWSLGSADVVTCHAVFLVTTGTYCAVRNGNELLLWKSDDKTLPLSHLTLPCVPLSILTPSLPHHLITVSEAGTVALVTVEGDEVRVVSEVELGGRRLRSRRLHVVGSVVREVAGRESVVVICGAGELFVCGTSKTGITLTSSLNLGSKIRQQSVCVCGDSLLVAVCCPADREGVVFAQCLLSSSPPQPLTTSPPGHTPCSLVAVSPSQFAITEVGGVVSLRDAIYGTRQASVDSGLSQIEMLWCVWESVVMCGEGVRVSQVTAVGGASLAAALGQKTTPPPEVLSVWEEPQTSDHWRSEVGSAEELARLGKLCDPEQTPTLEMVARLFPRTLSLPPPAYWQLVRRLARERRFWPHPQLMELVRAGAVVGSEAGEVVERALDQGDWALAVLTVSHAHCIPETSLVTLLQRALELPEVEESHGEELNRDSILWKVLALPYSDSLLQPPLSQLPLSSVMSLLEFLAPHVSVASLCRPPPLPYPQLLDWLATLLDTHWPALALAPVARQLLHNFKHTTYHQMLFCENLVTVQSVLEAGRSRPAYHQPQDQIFTIEKLKLKI